MAGTRQDANLKYHLHTGEVTHDTAVFLGRYKRRLSAKADQEREMVQRKIGATYWQVGALVYELYRLTGEEIAIVEGTVGKSQAQVGFDVSGVQADEE